VNDVLMPILGIFVGGINFTDLKIVIKEAYGETAELALYYGNFIQSIIDFLIIGFAIFVIIKLINSMHRKKKEPDAPPTPSKEEILLEEIRDILKERS
jgi:large conductance mechanosensitive channel